MKTSTTLQDVRVHEKYFISGHKLHQPTPDYTKMAYRDTAYKEHDIIYENGQIVVNESLNNKISETDYDTIVSDMKIMNTCIESGMASFNQLTGSFVIADVETVINNVPVYLFSLNALKTGSFVVSGFDASDYTDYLAIEEGFEDANLIE